MNLFADPRITKIEDTQAPSIDKRELDVLATVNTEPIQKIIKHEEPTMPTMPDFNLDALHAINQLERELAQLEKKAKGKAKPVADNSDDEDENDDNDNGNTADDNTEDDWSEHADAKNNKKKLAKRHKFEAMTDKIQREDGVSTTEAMSRARKLYPDLHASFQQYNPASPDAYSPAANTQKSYRSLVETEIAKGCNRVVAEQRVLQLYGAPPARITKAQNDMAEFNDAVDAYQALHGCSRTNAMTATRKRYADLYDRVNQLPTGNDGARRIQR